MGLPALERRWVICRSIKLLRNPQATSVDAPDLEEIRAAALQYVRKVSGYRKPSRRNATAFAAAVADVTDATRKLFVSLAAASLPATVSSPRA